MGWRTFHVNVSIEVRPSTLRKHGIEDTPREYTRNAPTYSALSEDWAFSIEAKYASMRTLPDPFGIPGPSFMPSLSARTIPKFYPPDLGTTWKCGSKPFRSEADALCAPDKWQRTAPRLRESSGGAQPARRKIVSFGLLGDQTLKFYHNPPGRTIPNHVSERTRAYRGTRTITIPPCRRAFFTTEHTESGSAGHRRRLGKDVVPMLQPQPCHRGRAPSRPLASPHVHFSHRSGIGPARDVPAPPSARGVRTRKGRNLLQPTGKRHPYHSPSLRPVNTEPRGGTKTRRCFESWLTHISITPPVTCMG